MKHFHDLKRRVHTLETLSEAISAMKSLAAHHFRKSREALLPARAYRVAIEDIVSSIVPTPAETETPSRAVLLIASNLGLCDGYNSHLSQTAIEHCRTVGVDRLYCVGQRPVHAVEQAGLKISRLYHAPSSVAGLTEVLLDLARDLWEDQRKGLFNHLEFVSARFDGVGAFTPTVTGILPISPAPPTVTLAPSRYVSAEHLMSVAVREYLYIRLYQTMLDSLAAEHGTRLVATNSAGEWLETKSNMTRRQLTSLKREATTQEVLEISSSVKFRMRNQPE